MTLSAFFRRNAGPLHLARLLVALLLFNQLAAASAAHALSGDNALMPVCTTTGIKYVKSSDSDDARVPAPDPQTDHCVLCAPPMPPTYPIVPARQFAALPAQLPGLQTDLRADLYRGFRSLSRAPPLLS